MSDAKLLRTASVHEDELSAIRDSRDRDMPIFSTNDGNITRWIVAVSEHNQRRVCHRRVLDDLSGVERHEQALA